MSRFRRVVLAVMFAGSIIACSDGVTAPAVDSGPVDTALPLEPEPTVSIVLGEPVQISTSLTEPRDVRVLKAGFAEGGGLAVTIEGPGQRVVARRLDPTGAGVGEEFEVAAGGEGAWGRELRAVVGRSDGGFVVTLANDGLAHVFVSAGGEVERTVTDAAFGEDDRELILHASSDTVVQVVSRRVGEDRFEIAERALAEDETWSPFEVLVADAALHDVDDIVGGAGGEGALIAWLARASDDTSELRALELDGDLNPIAPPVALFTSPWTRGGPSAIAHFMGTYAIAVSCREDNVVLVPSEGSPSTITLPSTPHALRAVADGFVSLSFATAMSSELTRFGPDGMLADTCAIDETPRPPAGGSHQLFGDGAHTFAMGLESRVDEGATVVVTRDVHTECGEPVDSWRLGSGRCQGSCRVG